MGFFEISERRNFATPLSFYPPQEKQPTGALRGSGLHRTWWDQQQPEKLHTDGKLLGIVSPRCQSVHLIVFGCFPRGLGVGMLMCRRTHAPAPVGPECVMDHRREGKNIPGSSFPRGQCLSLVVKTNEFNLDGAADPTEKPQVPAVRSTGSGLTHRRQGQKETLVCSWSRYPWMTGFSGLLTAPHSEPCGFSGKFCSHQGAL